VLPTTYIFHGRAGCGAGQDVIIDSRIGSVYDSAEVGSCLFER
jgi:hypothetical protein